MAGKKRNISHEEASARSKRGWITRRKNLAAELGMAWDDPNLPIGQTTKSKSGKTGTGGRIRKEAPPVTTAQARRAAQKPAEQAYWQRVVNEHEYDVDVRKQIKGISVAYREKARKAAGWYHVYTETVSPQGMVRGRWTTEYY